MKIVFWDWNGTLVNDALALCEAFNRVIEPRGGRAVTLDRYREIYRHPVRAMYEEVGVNLDQHSFDVIAREWHEHYESLVPAVNLHDDALKALQALRSGGSRQMVLSALPHGELLKSVSVFGVKDFFEHISGVADNRGTSKLEEGRSLFNRVNANASDITIIGDSSHDAEVARELSTNCILVARGAESHERLIAHGYEVIESFASLIER